MIQNLLASFLVSQTFYNQAFFFFLTWGPNDQIGYKALPRWGRADMTDGGSLRQLKGWDAEGKKKSLGLSPGSAEHAILLPAMPPFLSISEKDGKAHPAHSISFKGGELIKSSHELLKWENLEDRLFSSGFDGWIMHKRGTRRTGELYAQGHSQPNTVIFQMRKLSAIQRKGLSQNNEFRKEARKASLESAPRVPWWSGSRDKDDQIPRRSSPFAVLSGGRRLKADERKMLMVMSTPCFIPGII